jgi:hypothetical protein
VTDWLWRLPWLRGRTPLQRGLFGSVGLTLTLGLVCLVTSQHFFRDPPHGLLIGIGGVGATIYIAYVVGMSSLLRETKVRNGERESFVGTLTGFGISGFFGIGILLVLDAQPRPLHWFQAFGFACGAVCLFCLGVMVSALPLIAYDAARTAHMNPDE